MRKDAATLNKHWIARLAVGALFLIWIAGLRAAFVGGLNPGYVYYSSHRTYPTEGVLIVCLVMSGEFAAFVGILRPFNFSWCRIGIALAASSLLLVADLLLGGAGMHLPGYYYSNSFFLALTIAFLAIAAVSKGIFSLMRPASLQS
ncbi:MAG TPA: hypothetical protein VN873_15470 [Candidatus Angelobacter sp.]|nr:hypothetical protein [Candidatus Angelobacter sp.]